MWRIITLVIGGLILNEIFESTGSNKSEIPKRRIFVSHSWRKSGKEYQLFVNKLKRENIGFYDHSIPEEKAFSEERKQELKKIFRKQMTYCSKVFVLAKNGISQNSYVGMELEIANELGKEIVAVKPHGQIGMPAFIKRKAHREISNNSTSIKNILRS